MAEHGFRILEYKVDADSAAAAPVHPVLRAPGAGPGRLGAVFHGRRQGPADGHRRGAPDLHRRAGARQALRGAGARRAAVGGRREAARRRPSLPSTCATALRRCAPRAAATCCPTAASRASRWSPSTPSKVGVEVYRIGDRNLAQTLQGGDFQKQISSYELDTLKERTGARVYTGELDGRHAPQRGRDHRLPDRRGDPQAAARRLRAGGLRQRPRRKTRAAATPATQWFIVSDLGLTRHQRRRRRACLRALAGHAPRRSSTRSVRLLARNNEVLGTAKTDSRGYARFDAGLKRGEGGLAPAVLVAETPDGDYAFLDLSTAAFDLTDRGVKGRKEPGPIDAFAYTDRGVYRPGEQVHLTALARDRTGKASGVPVTRHLLAARRRRAFARDADRPGPGRPRHHADARRLGHDRHLARQGAHRSQGQPDRAGRVPGRGLRARAAGAQARGRPRRR